jgi:RsiW-degrading membrane proteinase PrsW (M82 family)
MAGEDDAALIRPRVSGLGFLLMFASDLAPGLVAACAIAPALLLLWLVIAGDSRPEPPRVVWTCVALGAVSVLPVAVVELWLLHHLTFSINPLLSAAQNALWIAAIPEETVKVGIIAAVALRSREFDEPMDGVVYGTAVGLGFAAVENFLYVIHNAHLVVVAGMRGIMSVPFHGAVGAIAGAYTARARFGGALGAHRHDGRWRTRMFVLAWLIPVVLHGLFDWSVFSLGALGQLSATAPSARIGGLILLIVVIWLAVGFGAIAFAVRLARRIARRQKAYFDTKRLPPVHWRAIWARSLSGLGLSVVAVVMLVIGDFTAKLGGLVVGAIAVAISAHCAKCLNEVAQAAHRRRVAANPG